MRRELLINPNSVLELEEYQTRISLLCKRFKYSIDELDVLRWLKNFEPEDRDAALEVLSLVEYFDDSEIIEAYEDCLQRVMEVAPANCKFVVMPIGDYGKSGTSMIYLLSKTKVYKNNEHRIKFAPYPSAIGKFGEGNRVYVFIDDYFGSGGSAVKYYEKKLKEQLLDLEHRVSFWISIISQENAIHTVHTKIPNCKVISWKIRHKAFLRDRSPFGNRERVKRFREVCYKYGYKVEREQPLGYDNTQGMVTFSYGAPNNLLPMFWSSRRFSRQISWYPIFPRFSKDRMERSREFRKETAFWLGLARTLSYEVYSQIATGRALSEWDSREYSFIVKTDFQLFCLIRLKRQRRSTPIICQILGISFSDYEELIKESQRRNILDSEESLTEYGEEAYREVMKKLLEYRLSSDIKEPSFFETPYVPHSFRGHT